MTYGAALRRLLKERDMSMAELSRRSGVSRQYLSMLSSGKFSEPSLTKAYQIADGLGVTVQTFLDLMHGEE